MKAVILAAGRGTRMGQLTKQVPKALLVSNGKRLIESVIEALPNEVVEIIVVIGFGHQQMKSFLNDRFEGNKFRFVTQGELKGTYSALASVPFGILEEGPYCVLNCDDLYSSSDLQFLCEARMSMGVSRGGEASKFQISSSGHVALKDDDHQGCPVVSTGAYFLDINIRDIPAVQNNDDEYSLPQSLVRAIKLKAIRFNHWKMRNLPQDL